MLMLIRQLLSVIALPFTMTIAGDANLNKTTYLTFNRPVGLPGVTLGSGTYVFELPEPMSSEGLNMGMAPSGSPLTLRKTVPLNPPVGVAVTV